MSNLVLRAALLALPLLITPASAHDFKIGDLKIDHPWSRATPGGAKVAGGFMKITNTGKESDRLIGGSAEISKVFEVHEMAMEGNVMKMRALEKGLEIKPGQTIELRPGSYHVMFIDLNAPIVADKPFKGFLTFEKAGKIEVEYKVEKAGTAKAGHGEHKH